MLKFLLVEDSAIVVKIIKHLVATEPMLECDVAMSFAEARERLADKPDYIACVVDLNLPDAPHGEVVDFTLSQDYPTIVLTGSYDENIRQQMIDKKVVDYVIKESRYSYEYVIRLIKRLDKNKHIKILIADDSKTSRSFIKSLLRAHLYQIVEAENGQEALELVCSDPDIKLLLTDYNMPVLNGFDLVKSIRREVDKNSLVIIGVSTQGSGSLSAKFIKNGANDFLTKPFFPEEFYCRLQHNIESMENLEALREAANRDFLTGLYNRRYLFSHAPKVLASAKKNDSPLSAVLMDIDHFKQINDTYGHDTGDAILVEFANLMRQAFAPFIFARMGGEEFCVLLNGLDEEKAKLLLENFRVMVEEHLMIIEDFSLKITISIGIASDTSLSLESMITMADRLVYAAKDSGRNTIATAESLF